MENLKLDDVYSISRNTYGFSLKKREETFNEETKKNTVSSEEWHVLTLKQALLKYLHQVGKVESTFEEILGRLTFIENKIDKLDI